LTTNSQNDLIEHDLQAHFEVKSLGQPSMLLGIKLHQEDHLITLSQTHFIDTLLKKFGLENANPVSTLMDNILKVSLSVEQEE